MNVAIWDTYVKRKDGSVLHFDILAPDYIRDAAHIYSYGKSYLLSVKEAGSISTRECQFCHIEQAAPEIESVILAQGYYILPMETIPALMPSQPGRRELILHLRGHYERFRFQDFAGLGLEDLKQLVSTAEEDEAKNSL